MLTRKVERTLPVRARMTVALNPDEEASAEAAFVKQAFLIPPRSAGTMHIDGSGPRDRVWKSVGRKESNTDSNAECVGLIDVAGVAEELDEDSHANALNISSIFSDCVVLLDCVSPEIQHEKNARNLPMTLWMAMRHHVAVYQSALAACSNPLSAEQ